MNESWLSVASPSGSRPTTTRRDGAPSFPSVLNQVNLGPQVTRQDLDGFEGRVRVSSLDAANLALLNARLRRELALGQPKRLATLDELPGELEVGAKLRRFGDRIGSLFAGLSLDLAHELCEPAPHAFNMGFSPSAVKSGASLPIRQPLPCQGYFRLLAFGACVLAFVVATKQENELPAVRMAEDPKEHLLRSALPKKLCQVSA